MITIEKISGNCDLKRNGVSGWIIDYGSKNQNFNSSVILHITSDVGFKKLTASPGCGGCTTVSQSKRDNNTFSVSIRYDSELLGRISKTVTVKATELDGKEEKIVIKLSGMILSS